MNVDIIQIKKPFYGNVFRAEIDNTSDEVISFKTINNLKQFEKNNMRKIADQTIKMFYKCLINESEIQNLNNEYLKAQCSNSQGNILLKIDSDIWEMSGFVNDE